MTLHHEKMTLHHEKITLPRPCISCNVSA
jgi:hypothetical protein